MKQIILLLLMLVCGINTLSAQAVDPNDPADNNAMASKKRRDKQTKQQEEKIDTKKADWYVTTVYLFAASAHFGDSVEYVTDIIALDSVQLTKKYDYLKYRSDFTFGFKQYLADNYGCENQTCAIFYDTKLKKAQKRFNKVLKRAKTNKMHVTTVSKDKFTFTLPDYKSLAQ